MSDRINESGYREAIGWALDLIPSSIRVHLEFDVFCGADPVFAGLHSFRTTFDGRSYKDTAHVAYPWNIDGPASRRRTTLVLPTRLDAKPRIVVHELGHVLHKRLDFRHRAEPVSRYARSNIYEAFAEAFTSWIFHGYADHPDQATCALLESL